MLTTDIFVKTLLLFLTSIFAVAMFLAVHAKRYDMARFFSIMAIIFAVSLGAVSIFSAGV